ncbi:hypothetical protein [Nonomuraea sp. SYSU D8015]|uniref:hypothetical protein n=1 Tax=Nonomuraea sp. SYSU D8015 TaxID=2593644 RepID=UPI0016615750|nr:hypothetical protein [Nonomuraea sp. SYSU D8015]
MRFWKTIFGLARKKLVGPPIALATIGLALAGYFLMPSSYVSTASMVLTVPATGGTLETEPQRKPGLTNPLLQFSDALRTTAGILILSTNTEDVAAELGVTEDGPTTLTINDGRTNPDLLSISTNGPFIYLEVESTSADVVRDVMAKAQRRVRVELANWQTALGAPISTHIGILDVMPASVPKPEIQGKLMAAAGGGLSALVAGFGLAYGYQRLRQSRGGSAEPENAPEPEAEATPERAAEPALVMEVAPDAFADPMEGSLVKFGHGPVRKPAEEPAEAVVGNGSKPQVGALTEFAPDTAELGDADTQTFPAIKPEDDQPDSTT